MILNDYLSKIGRSLPELCSTNDLVKLGIFRSAQAAFFAREAKLCPSFFKNGKKVVYPKEAVLEWLKNNWHDCSTPK